MGNPWGNWGKKFSVPVTSVLPTGVTELTKKNLYVLYVIHNR